MELGLFAGGRPPVPVHEQSCGMRIGSSLAIGTFTGVFVAAAEALWKQNPNSPLERRITTQQLTQLMKVRAGTFAGAMVAFAAVECTANSFMGAPKWQGTMLGGVASGGVLALASKKPVGSMFIGTMIGLSCLGYAEAGGFRNSEIGVDGHPRMLARRFQAGWEQK